MTLSTKIALAIDDLLTGEAKKKKILKAADKLWSDGDYKGAEKEFMKLVEKGDADACYELSRMYAGLCRKSSADNLETARLLLLEKAYSAGHQMAREVLEEEYGLIEIELADDFYPAYVLARFDYQERHIAAAVPFDDKDEEKLMFLRVTADENGVESYALITNPEGIRTLRALYENIMRKESEE